MIDFNSTFANELVTFQKVVVANGSVDAAGGYVSGNESFTDFSAVRLQPVKMNELTISDRGLETDSYVKTYTETNLENKNEIIANGTRYIVVQVEERESFYKVFLRKLQ